MNKIDDFYYLIELIEENNKWYGDMGSSWDSWNDVDHVIDSYPVNLSYPSDFDDEGEKYWIDDNGVETKEPHKIVLTEREREVIDRAIETNGASLENDIKKLQEERGW